jgi:hypothetical protein
VKRPLSLICHRTVHVCVLPGRFLVYVAITGMLCQQPMQMLLTHEGLSRYLSVEQLAIRKCPKEFWCCIQAHFALKAAILHGPHDIWRLSGPIISVVWQLEALTRERRLGHGLGAFGMVGDEEMAISALRYIWPSPHKSSRGTNDFKTLPLTINW